MGQHSWTNEAPTQPGRYKIRPFPLHRIVIGTEQIDGEREVTLAYVKGMEYRGLCIYLDRSVIAVNNQILEFLGPLETPT